MAKKKKSTKKTISNKRARFDYQLNDPVIAGVVLTGAETKAIRNGHAQLRGSYVNILSNELWLVNASISGSNAAPISEDQVTRSRKLLIKKRELANLIRAKNEGNTIVPLEIFNFGQVYKGSNSLRQGNKTYDKRQILKKRDETRNINRFIKSAS